MAEGSEGKEERKWKLNKQPDYFPFLVIYIYHVEGFSGAHKHLSVGGTSMLSVPAAAHRDAAGRRSNKLISATENLDNKVPAPAQKQYIYMYICVCLCVWVCVHVCI